MARKKVPSPVITQSNQGPISNVAQFPGVYRPMGVASTVYPVRINSAIQTRNQQASLFRFYEDREDLADRYTSASQINGQQNYAASSAFFQR